MNSNYFTPWDSWQVCVCFISKQCLRNIRKTEICTTVLWLLENHKCLTLNFIWLHLFIMLNILFPRYITCIKTKVIRVQQIVTHELCCRISIIVNLRKCWSLFYCWQLWFFAMQIKNIITLDHLQTCGMYRMLPPI